jgi:hypothetical protein
MFGQWPNPQVIAEKRDPLPVGEIGRVTPTKDLRTTAMRPLSFVKNLFGILMY